MLSPGLPLQKFVHGQRLAGNESGKITFRNGKIMTHRYRDGGDQRYVGHMQTVQGMWYAWIVEPRDANRVVWSLRNSSHKPILEAIKAELRRLGLDRPKITAEWPDTPRPPGVN